MNLFLILFLRFTLGALSFLLFADKLILGEVVLFSLLFLLLERNMLTK